MEVFSASFVLYCNEDLGPCFGNNDIFICSESNKYDWNFCHFGNTYQHPDVVRDTAKAENILAGSSEFVTQEIEVFVKQLENLTA